MDSGKQINAAELKELLHETEDSRFDIALMAALAVIGIGFLAMSSLDELAWIVLFPIITIAVSVWLAIHTMKAHLMANAVRVTSENFPEVHQVLQDVCYTLDYTKPVDVYVVEEGAVNAFLMRFFATKFIILNSELVEDMTSKETLPQMKWIIARFVGALRAKHDKLDALRIAVESVEHLKVFNLLLLPYERAIQYSGDQIGLAVCGDLEQTMIAYQKFMVGNNLARRVNAESVLDQKAHMGIFAVISRLFMTHPHMVDRFANLLVFAERRYPKMYEAYIRSQRS